MNLASLLQTVIDEAQRNHGIAYLFLSVAPHVPATPVSNLKEVAACETAHTLAELEEALFRVQPTMYDVIKIDMDMTHTHIYYGTSGEY